MVDAQVLLFGCSDVFKELKQRAILHRVAYITFQHVLHGSVVSDCLALSHQQAAAFPWQFLLRVSDDGFENVFLDSNRRHNNKSQSWRRPLP